MRQSKSTLEIRDSRHSWSQLKTDTFSGKRGINNGYHKGQTKKKNNYNTQM